MRRLDGPTAHGDEEATAGHLADRSRRATELERARIVAKLDEAPIINAGAAAKRQRRTPDQQAREAMLKECRKQRMVMPLRTFARKFADVGLLDAVPIWLTSPETMAVLFPRQPLFDLVIFDEASQCTVENGVPVVVRAKRVVVAGDEKQMPPTSFFTSKGGTDDETADEDEVAVRDVFEGESLLTMARARVPHIGLEWHYRCLDEELIAFSNHAMYGGSLLTVPSTASRTAPPALRWVAVPDGRNEKGRNDPEAVRVVDVLADLIARPKRPTVGVVTFNIQQRQAVLDEVDRRRGVDGTFRDAWDAAMSAERLDERPFVKNLENVQGDERDIIVFSPAYAPVERASSRGAERVVPARFGPLGLRGGERRLNVAISRAKSECIIVASFEPSMLSVARTTHLGPKLFRDFLDFAYLLSAGRRAEAERVLARAGEATVRAPQRSTLPPLPGYVPLKAQIAMALQQTGIPAELDVGTSALRVPLAVGAAQGGRYVVAVLCDEGEEAMTSFERHVHRPGLLRARGWHVVRVTAREWARDPKRVLARICAPLGPRTVAAGRSTESAALA